MEALRTMLHSTRDAPGKPACSNFVYALFTALLAGVNNGYNTVLSTALVPRLKELPNAGLTDSSSGLLTGGIFLGSIVGIILGGVTCECYGRRHAIAIGEGTIVFFTLMQVVWLNVWYVLR